MALRFYNTLTRKKEVFKPIKEGLVKMYTCGPTVYDYAHIGNFRAYIAADLLRRYLLYRGYKLKHVMNVTDVDDKTIKGSREQMVSLKEYTEKYTKAFFEDLDTLNIERADIFPKATTHIGEMVNLVKKLMEKGYAYKGIDGIYYDISKFKDYGKFAQVDMKGLKPGARVSQDNYDKEFANDFALWKFWDKEDGDVYWKTDIGKGRPGWHIECSAMSMTYLGETFDIHTGGVDLIFPHHQNEIAQSEGANGAKFVNYWLHNEHLLVNGQKMSKSLGNFYTLRDLLNKGYNPPSIRYVLLSTHYRQKLDFSEGSIKNADKTLKRIHDFMAELQTVKGDNVSVEIERMVNETKKRFEESMNDDLNISEALAAIFDMMTRVNKAVSEKKIGKINAQRIYGLMLEFDKVLGLKLEEKEQVWHTVGEAQEEIRQLIEKREDFRKKKNWSAADGIRNELRKKDIIVQDTDSGPRWRSGKKTD